MRAKLLSDPVCPSLIQICNFVFIHKWICDSFLCNRSWELLSIQSSNNLFTIFKETKRYKNCVFFSWNYKSHPIITNRSQKKLLRIHLSRVLFILIASLLLYVKEVYWPILYSNLLYKIGHYLTSQTYSSNLKPLCSWKQLRLIGISLRENALYSFTNHSLFLDTFTWLLLLFTM